MIGIYNYTVILTYLSLAAAIIGLGFAFNGNPYAATLCLMIAGLCDGFDGKVARTKKNRSDAEKNYGIQLDSLADVIAFGVLPVAIGFSIGMTAWYFWPIGAVFVIAALTRLAHFNVMEEEYAKVKKERNLSFIGLPTTSVALFLPLVIIAKVLFEIYVPGVMPYFPFVFAAFLLVVAGMFVVKIYFVNKPNNRGMVIYIITGIIEVTAMGFLLWLATQ
jgi:CDP-diacylglycerol--serine O-phosphatidyltransferase